MSTTPPDTFEFADHSPRNEAALEELTSAIAFGQGADTITLLLVRCNYGDLRERMVAALVARLAAEDLDGPIHTLRLGPQATNLYAQVQALTADTRPGVVLVLGTEGVDALDVLLVEMNKRREEFRRDFPFPVVLWFTDDGYRQLSSYANDFESIAGGETIEFRLDQATLTQQLQGAAQRLFDALLAPDRRESFNRRLIGLDLGCLSPGEVAIALADLQAQGADLSLDLQATLAFARGLNIRNEDAIALFDQSAAQWQTLPEPRAALKRGLALFYLGRARYFAADNEKYQSPDWTPAVAPLQAALEIFEQAQRPDLMAQGMIPLARVLHRLEQWDDLEALIQRAIPLHEAHSSPDRLAQDYGFLADVALHREDWPQAATLAQRALDLSTPSWWQILYLKMLAQAQQVQGQIAAATANLQAAQALGVMDHPKLHSDVLGLLQQCLRAQGRYLEAFEVKRERLAVEQQYGLRAFIGAGRLRSRRTEARATVQSQRRSTEAVAPEIAASGRQRDLDELLKRIAGKEHKLIVLHGASGVGKSSLVNGGLLPALQGRALDNRDNIPVLLRQYTDWAGELTQRLTAAVDMQNAKFRSQDSEGGSQELGARSQELGARSQGLGAGSQEPGARSQEPSSPTLTPAYPSTPTPKPSGQASPTHPHTHTLLATLRECEDYTLRPVLIFDQFEEFFFANPDPVDRRVFFEFVVACLELQPSALKIVLSLREDYIHYLLEARQAVRRSDLPPGSMARSQLEDILGKQILYAIANFSPEDATAIINSLAAGSRMYLEPALIAALVADLAGPLQEVRPIEMQIVGAQLQTEGIQTLAQYRCLGDQPKETLVQRYLQDVVEDCGEEHRQLAELVLFLLTDERGTRPLKTRPELVRDLEALSITLSHADSKGVEGLQEEQNLDLVLRILCGSGIVQQFPDNPDDHYQLVHDYLAGVIRSQQARDLLQELKLTRQEKNAISLERDTLAYTNRTLASARKKSGILLVVTIALAAVIVGTAVELAERTTQEANRKLQESAILLEVEQQISHARQQFELSEIDALETALNAALKLRSLSESNAQNIFFAATIVTLQNILHQISEKNRFYAGNSDVLWVEFCQSGKLVVGDELGTLQVHKNFGVVAHEIKAHEGPIWRITCIEKDNSFATVGYDGFIRIWNLEGELIKEIEAHNGGGGASNIIFNSRKNFLFSSGYSDGLIRIWDLSGNLITEFEGHTGKMFWLEVSPDGNTIATTGSDGTFRTWNTSGIQLNSVQKSGGSFTSLAFNANGDKLAVASEDGEIQVWNIQSWELISKIEGHPESVTSLNFRNFEGQDEIVSVGDDGTVRLWSIQGTELRRMYGHTDRIWSSRLDTDSRHLLTSGADGVVRLWDLAKKYSTYFKAHDGSAWSVNVDHSGKYIVTSGQDGKSFLWSNNGHKILTLDDGDSEIFLADFSPDGNKIVSTGQDGMVKVWNTEGNQISAWKANSGSVFSADFNSDGSMIVTGGQGGELSIWDTHGNLLKKISSDSKDIYGVSFSPSEKMVAIANETGMIQIWSVEGDLLSSFNAHRDAALWVEFHPEGDKLASSGRDGVANLWDLDGEKLAEFKGHQGRVSFVDFNQKGDILITAGRDGTARIWTLSGQEISRFEDHSGGALSVSFNQHENKLIVADAGGHISSWEVQNFNELIHNACHWLKDYSILKGEYGFLMCREY